MSLLTPRLTRSDTLFPYPSLFRSDRNVLRIKILPDVELGPIAEREDADRLAARLPGIVEVPQLRPLALGIPAMLGRAEAEDALLRAALLLVPARAAKGGVEAIFRSEERRCGKEWCSTCSSRWSSYH